MGSCGENLRYLLWRERQSIARKDWVEALATWAGCTSARARMLLQGSAPSAEELASIADALNMEDFEVAGASPEASEILPANIDYLLDQAGHGAQKNMAESIGVSVNTVSRWRLGKQTPERRHIDLLCRYFRLEDGTDLIRQPVFLTEDPVSDLGRRDWLCRKIQEADAEMLNTLFPALKRLLDGNA